MRVFLTRANFIFSSSTLITRKTSEKRVILWAFKIWRGLLARAIQNFGDNKVSKTGFFENEKSEGKKPMVEEIK